jgi:hypothetical protein
MMQNQSTDTVLMIRPASFKYNIETAQSNAFQKAPNIENSNDLALQEFDSMVAILRAEGVNVWVEEDSIFPEKPDAIFPNNWLGIHPGKQIILYPMAAENRRLERDPQLISRIQSQLPGYSMNDFSVSERDGEYLEGTGSLIFDHIQKRVFASRSNRTHEKKVIEIAEMLNFKPVIFDAIDADSHAYYHTNVVLCIGTHFGIVCSESIPENDRYRVIEALSENGRALLHITREQVTSFAGNVLELRNSSDETLIVLSSSAMNALAPSELAFLQQFGLLLPIDIPFIEQTGGGSVRCMMAEVFD